MPESCIKLPRALVARVRDSMRVRVEHVERRAYSHAYAALLACGRAATSPVYVVCERARDVLTTRMHVETFLRASATPHRVCGWVVHAHHPITFTVRGALEVMHFSLEDYVIYDAC